MSFFSRLPEEIRKSILALLSADLKNISIIASVCKAWYMLIKKQRDFLKVEKLLISYENFKQNYRNPERQRALKSLVFRKETLTAKDRFLAELSSSITNLAKDHNASAQIVLFKSHCYSWYKTKMSKSDQHRDELFKNLISKDKKNSVEGLDFLRLAASEIVEAKQLLSLASLDLPSSDDFSLQSKTTYSK